MSTQTAHFLPKDGKLLVIIGPSGSGKSTLVSQLVDNGILELTSSWTTRPERADDDQTHVFVTKETFEARKDERFFLETASPLNMPYEYGLPRVTHNNLDAVPTVLLRAMVMDLLGKHYTNYLVYQIESPRDIVAERLKQRGTSIEDIDNRLALYDREVTAGRTMADRVFHNDSSFESLKTSFLTALREDFLE